MPTGEETKDLLLLYRLIEHQYQITNYTDEALKQIQRSLNIARNDLLATLDMMDFRIIEGRETELLRELNRLTFGVQAQLTGDIVEASVIAGEASYREYGNILSFDGALVDTVGFNFVSVLPDQLRSMVTTVPVGGKLLNEWVRDTFEKDIIENIKDVIVTENLKGVSTPKIINMLEDGFGLIQRDAESLTRSYIADVNNVAAKAVYDANSDIIELEQWNSTLEVGLHGKSTCLRCAGIDGRKFRLDEPHIRPPLHINCRCFMTPVTKSYKELGLNIDEMKRSLRPYTERAEKRQILEAGKFEGDFDKFLKTRSVKYQKDLLGPNRYRLIREGKIKFDDLVDKDGNIRLLKKNQDGDYIGLQK